MTYKKDGCNIVDVDIEFIEKYVSNNPSILLKPYINGKISYIKYDEDGPKFGWIESKEFLPFEHDFWVDLKKLNYNPVLMEMVTGGETPAESDDCLLFGKFNNITDSENIVKLFFSGARIKPLLVEFAEEFYPYCGLQIKKEGNIYTSSLTKNSFQYDDYSYYHDISYLSGSGIDLKSSLDSLEQHINAYNSDEIIKLLANEYNNNTNLRFKVDNKKKILFLTNKL